MFINEISTKLLSVFSLVEIEWGLHVQCWIKTSCELWMLSFSDEWGPNTWPCHTNTCHVASSNRVHFKVLVGYNTKRAYNIELQNVERRMWSERVVWTSLSNNTNNLLALQPQFQCFIVIYKHERKHKHTVNLTLDLYLHVIVHVS